MFGLVSRDINDYSGVLGFDSKIVGFNEDNLTITAKVIQLFSAPLRATA